AAFASVLAIDYGSDWIKASLMKPGVPFDVLLNKDSKRKIQASVGWKKTDQLFGSDAYSIVYPTGRLERDHIVDALELGGLRIFALFNDGTAVAVNYAMTRAFPAPEYHVIYDAGASSVRATVVQFSSEGAGKGKAADTQITVAGVGYNREIGGTEMDRRLRDILVNEFNAKHKKDIRADRLLRE
ncbi:hypothetical protein FIBSPDRAFT_906269, partial [Athelia psychrophila]